MSKQLIKTFKEIKSSCKTRSQRLAFNALVKSFSEQHVLVVKDVKDGTHEVMSEAYSKDNDNTIIKAFLKENYDIGSYTIKNGIVNVKGDIEVKNREITSLTNGLFEFGKVDGDFDCSHCKSLTSLEGAPKEVVWNFYCNNCESLTSLKGAPEKVGGFFNCSCCKSLKTLEGAPKEVGGDFYCSYCKSLTSLKGAPKANKIYSDIR